MKNLRLLGIISGLLLIFSGILPIGKINTDVISIFPVYNNLDLGIGMWMWRDISAFAVSFGLLALLAIVFSLRKWELGNIITGVLLFIVSMFILFALWLAQLKTLKFSDVEFTFGIAWLFIVAGIGLLLFENIKEFKLKKGH